MAEDPRKDIKQFEGTVSFNDDNKLEEIIFKTIAELLDARYELIELNKPILIKDKDAEKTFLIESNRIASSNSNIDLTVETLEE